MSLRAEDPRNRVLACIVLPDRQMPCAPIDSIDGRAYLGAMAAAANFAWANRHAIADRVRRSVAAVLGERAAEACEPMAQPGVLVVFLRMFLDQAEAGNVTLEHETRDEHDARAAAGIARRATSAAARDANLRVAVLGDHGHRAPGSMPVSRAGSSGATAVLGAQSL